MDWRVLVLMHAVHASVGPTTFDSKCDISRQCSQAPRSQHENHFPCEIGHKEECDQLLEENANPVDWHHVDKNGCAMLSSIKIYEKRYPGLPNTSPSFDFSVRLPTHRQSLLDTHAVKVDFESPKGNGADSYYSDHPVCRVFNFKAAKMTEYNLQNPRIIPYACLVGLELAHNFRYIYHIAVETFPNRAQVNYTVVAHKLLQKIRNMTLAVAPVPLRRSIHVVFEPSPPSYSVHSYTVSLNNTLTGDTKAIVLSNKYEHEFLDCPPGFYVVTVEPNGSSCPKDDCRGTHSEPVSLQYLEPSEFATSTDFTLKVLSSAVGAISGLLLILVMCCLYHRYRQHIGQAAKTILLLYISNYQTDADSLDKLLESLDFQVFKRKYEETDENNSNERQGSFEEEDMFESKCKEMDKIIMLCSTEISQQCRTTVSIEEQPLRKYSSYKNTFLAFRKNPTLSSKIVIVCFDTASHQHIQLEEKSSSFDWLRCIKNLDSTEKYPKKACYCLPKDFHKLHCDLIQRRKTKHYANSQEWKDFESVKEEMSEEVMNNVRRPSEPDPIYPLQEDSLSESDGPDPLEDTDSNPDTSSIESEVSTIPKESYAIRNTPVSNNDNHQPTRPSVSHFPPVSEHLQQQQQQQQIPDSQQFVEMEIPVVTDDTGIHIYPPHPVNLPSHIDDIRQPQIHHCCRHHHNPYHHHPPPPPPPPPPAPPLARPNHVPTGCTHQPCIHRQQMMDLAAQPPFGHPSHTNMQHVHGNITPHPHQMMYCNRHVQQQQINRPFSPEHLTTSLQQNSGQCFPLHVQQHQQAAGQYCPQHLSNQQQINRPFHPEHL